jgi:hypothetical protein
VDSIHDKRFLSALEYIQSQPSPLASLDAIQIREAARMYLEAHTQLGLLSDVRALEVMNRHVFEAVNSRVAGYGIGGGVLEGLGRQRAAEDVLHHALADQNRMLDALNATVGKHQALADIANQMRRSSYAIEHASRSFRMTELGIPESIQVSQTGIDRVVGRLDSLDLLNTHPELSARLLEPYSAHARFAERMGRRVGELETEAQAAALRGTLLISDNLVTESAETLDRSLVAPTDGDASLAAPKYNVERVIQRELRTNKSISPDLDLFELLSLTPAGLTTIRAQHVVGMVYQCLERHQFEGARQIFRGTTKVWSSCNYLPFSIVRDRLTLGEFLDRMYFIFYEGTGDAKRLLADDFLSKPECEFIWKIKHLRTWVRHDEEHGSDGDIRATRRKIMESFQWFGLSRLPRTGTDHQNVHRRIIEEAEEFLSCVIGRL